MIVCINVPPTAIIIWRRASTTLSRYQQTGEAGGSKSQSLVCNANDVSTTPQRAPYYIMYDVVLQHNKGADKSARTDQRLCSLLSAGYTFAVHSIMFCFVMLIFSCDILSNYSFRIP